MFTQAFGHLGLYPDFGATFFLPRLVGLSRASELFYTAERLSAEEAHRIGIVASVFSSGSFEEETRKLAERVAAGPPAGVPRREAHHGRRSPHGTARRHRRREPAAASLLSFRGLRRGADGLRREAPAEIPRFLRSDSPSLSKSRIMPEASMTKDLLANIEMTPREVSERHRARRQIPVGRRAREMGI